MAVKLEVFFSYAHADEEWRDKLEKHLGGLKRQRRILTWHDRKILPGAEWAPEIGAHLSSADIILLLISSDFISSEYCWSVELKQAIKRHEAGNARVIPIIVRPVNWKKTPFARLQALPKDGKPVSTWSDIDEALLNVAEGVQNAVEDLRPETKSLSMHRLVQAVLKDGMDQRSQEQWAERTVRTVNHLFPFGTADTWHLCQRYLPHAILCAEYIEQWSMASYETGRLLHSTASYLNDRAQYREAELLYQRALTIVEQVLGPDHPNTAQTLNSLAGLYWHQGKYEQAVSLLKRALMIKERVLGADHPDTAQSLNNLANLYAEQGKYEQAEPLYQRVLAIRERVLGADHPDTVRVLENYVILLKKMRREGEATGLEARVKAIRAKVEGSEEGK